MHELWAKTWRQRRYLPSLFQPAAVPGELIVNLLVIVSKCTLQKDPGIGGGLRQVHPACSAAVTKSESTPYSLICKRLVRQLIRFYHSVSITACPHMLAESSATSRNYDIESPETVKVLNEAADEIASVVEALYPDGLHSPEAPLIREVSRRQFDEIQAADIAAGWARDALRCQSRAPWRSVRARINGWYTGAVNDSSGSFALPVIVSEHTE